MNLNKTHFNNNIQILLGAFLWAGLAYAVIYGSGALPGNDPYFHVQLSEIMKNYKIVLDSFPWTTHSVWNTGFFDKDWLFHVFLIPFLFLGKLTGAKVALVTLVFIIAIAWGSLFKTIKCRHILFAMLLLLFCSAYAFPGRLILLRGHLLSIFFIALALMFIIRKWGPALAVICVLYSLSYTGSWQVVPIAVLFDIIGIIHLKITPDKSQLKIYKFASPWAILGIIIGTLINPYFPANISGGIIQNIIVLKSGWMGTPGANIVLGDELYPILFKKLFTVYLPVILILLGTLYYCINSKKKLEKIVITIFFGLLSLIYLILTLLTVKFTDYLVPFSVAFAISAWDKEILFWGKKSVFSYFLVILLCASGLYSVQKLRSDSLRPYPLYYGATKWLNENIQNQDSFSKTFKPGKIIFTGEWCDTPALFYGAPQFRYLVFLDPNFMYAYSPEKYKLWKRITDGKALYPAVSIYKEFHSNIVFVSKLKRPLFHALKNSPYAKLKYVGPDKESIFTIDIPRGHAALT